MLDISTLSIYSVLLFHIILLKKRKKIFSHFKLKSRKKIENLMSKVTNTASQRVSSEDGCAAADQ